MDTPRIAFIGAGNMAQSLVGGLIAQGYAPAALSAADPEPGQCARIAARYGIAVSADNAAVVPTAQVVVLAVKPQAMRPVLTALAPHLAATCPLVISIAAGIRIEALARWAGDRLPLVRVMPNTPALLGCGVSALYANAHAGTAERRQAEAIMAAVGATLWLESEGDLDAVTALSGSGPAYFFLVMEAMEAAGVALGLQAGAARRLTLHTALGAARMALESSDDPATLRARVTSKGGTTERAIEVLEAHAALRTLFERALTAACDRSRELAAELGSAS